MNFKMSSAKLFLSIILQLSCFTETNSIEHGKFYFNLTKYIVNGIIVNTYAMF